MPSRLLRSNRVAWKAVGEIKITFGTKVTFSLHSVKFYPYKMKVLKTKVLSTLSILRVATAKCLVVASLRVI